MMKHTQWVEAVSRANPPDVLISTLETVTKEVKASGTWHADILNAVMKKTLTLLNDLDPIRLKDNYLSAITSLWKAIAWCGPDATEACFEATVCFLDDAQQRWLPSTQHNNACETLGSLQSATQITWALLDDHSGDEKAPGCIRDYPKCHSALRDLLLTIVTRLTALWSTTPGTAGESALHSMENSFLSHLAIGTEFNAEQRPVVAQWFADTTLRSRHNALRLYCFGPLALLINSVIVCARLQPDQTRAENALMQLFVVCQEAYAAPPQELANVGSSLSPVLESLLTSPIAYKEVISGIDQFARANPASLREQNGMPGLAALFNSQGVEHLLRDFNLLLAEVHPLFAMACERTACTSYNALESARTMFDFLIFGNFDRDAVVAAFSKQYWHCINIPILIHLARYDRLLHKRPASALQESQLLLNVLRVVADAASSHAEKDTLNEFLDAIRLATTETTTLPHCEARLDDPRGPSQLEVEDVYCHNQNLFENCLQHRHGSIPRWWRSTAVDSWWKQLIDTHEHFDNGYDNDDFFDETEDET